MIDRSWRSEPLVEWFLGDDETRLSLEGAMMLGLVGFLGLAALVSATGLDPRAGVVAFALGVAALAWWSAPAAALSLAVMAFLFVDGFVLEHGGSLRWHGGADALRLFMLLVVALLVSNSSQNHVERMRRKRIRAALVGRGPKF